MKKIGFWVVFCALALSKVLGQSEAVFIRLVGPPGLQIERLTADGVLSWRGQVPGERVFIQRSQSLTEAGGWEDYTSVRPFLSAAATWVLAPEPPEHFVFAPPGHFMMGSPDGSTDTPAEPGRWPDEVLHEVSLNPFYVQTTPVTWTQWNEVRDWALLHGYVDLPVGRKGSHGDGRNTDGDPVTMVNWYDVVKWLNAFSEKEELESVYRVGGEVYRTGIVAARMKEA